MSKRLLIGFVVFTLLAGCGGGGGGGSVSPTTSSSGSSSTPSPSSGASKAPTEQIAIHLKINPSATTSSNKRHAQYVSPATNGVLVQVYTSPKSANPIPIGTSATDVSPGSAACGGVTGTRTCTIYIPAPAGTDDFVFTTYDQPPIPGTTTFPAGANILSVGEVTQTITLAGTNTVNAALGGVITSLAVMPLTQSAVNGIASSYTLAITAFDADGNAILSGSTDPYNNPITVTATEIPGGGFTSLTLGGQGGTGSSSVTLAQSSQAVTVLYSGGGSPGYYAQFAVSSQGVPTAIASFAPFIVWSLSSHYAAATSAVSFNAPGQTAEIDLAEYGFTGTFTATAGASCANVATVSVPAAGGVSSATVTAGANAGTCTVTFSDGTVSAPVTVTTQYTSSTITIPSSAISGTFTEFPIPTAGSASLGIAAGPDGAMWFGEAVGNNIGRITTAGSITEFPVEPYDSSPEAITAGPDGALWFAGGYIGRITTSGAVSAFPGESSGSFSITRGPDGAVWFSEGNAGKIGRITTSGTLTEYVIPSAGSDPNGIVTGADGALWFTEQNVYKIGRITTAGAFTEYPLPQYEQPYHIAAGPDGALWFTEPGFNQIGRITTGGSVTEYNVPTSSSDPGWITAGPDGALWFSEIIGNNIGRITTGGVITEYRVPTSASQPSDIATGPDGAIWFVESAGNKIGRLR